MEVNILRSLVTVASLVLFLAQSVSIAFYCIGFGEAVGALWSGAPPHAERWIALGAISFLFIFAWLGADWATRFQYLVMAILAAALASFFVGGLAHWDGALLARNWSAAAWRRTSRSRAAAR